MNATPITKDDIRPGTLFWTRGKHPRYAEVVDIFRTYNMAGELVETEYLCQHEFAGQMVTHKECAVTIQRGYAGQSS